jgi:hypothetical protein
MASKIDWMKPENRFKATPMDLLKQGLEDGNWEAVSAAYLSLTGDKIVVGETPKKKRGRPSKKTAPKPEPEVEELVEEEVDEYFPEEGIELRERIKKYNEDDVTRTRSKIKTKTCKAGTTKFVNKFIDDQTEALDDLKFNPTKEALAKIKIKQRPPHKMIRITCSRCGKQEKADPIIANRRLDKDYSAPVLCNSCSCVPGPGG